MKANRIYRSFFIHIMSRLYIESHYIWVKKKILFILINPFFIHHREVFKEPPLLHYTAEHRLNELSKEVYFGSRR